MSDWCLRQVLFTMRWRHEEEGQALVAQVDRQSWGYTLMIVRDPDGNELYFPYPKDFIAQPADGF